MVGHLTAWRMLFGRRALQPGESVLIVGIGGGVAVACLQLAQMVGARVFVTSSSDAKISRAVAMGASGGVNYRKDVVSDAVLEMSDGGVDMVVNYTGGDTWVPSLRVLKRGGRLLVCGATAGFAPTEDLRYIWTFELRIIGSNSWAPSDLETLMKMIAEGRLKPTIDTVLPLEQTREGVRQLRDREVIGKIVIEP